MFTAISSHDSGNGKKKKQKKKKKKSWKLSFHNFKNPKSSFVGTMKKIIQEKLDKFRLIFVEEVVLWK